MSSSAHIPMGLCPFPWMFAQFEQYETSDFELATGTRE